MPEQCRNRDHYFVALIRVNSLEPGRRLMMARLER